MHYQASTDQQLSEFVYKTKIAGLYFVKHKSFSDERGFYSEIARVNEIEALTNEKFVVQQMGHSRSQTNVLRGFHAEDWNKLATLASGKILSIIVDIRPDSPTFAQYEQFVLGFDSESLQGALYISRGLANGFAVLEGPADYIYMVDALYSQRDKSKDKAIALFDPDLKINWPIAQEKMIFSKRDKNSVTLRELFPQNFL